MDKKREVGKKVTDKMIGRELTKTLHAYERLIEDPEGEAPRWKNFGSFNACRMCRLFVSDHEYSDGTIHYKPYDCKSCPLAKEPVFIGCYSNEITKLANLLNLYHNWGEEISFKKLASAAKARYQWILKTIKRNGWEYK